MRALSSADFLSLWERGLRLHPLDRGLLALSAALPEVPHENLADWPLGRRNSALVKLRSSSFGSSLRGWTCCPQCEEKMEFEMDGNALMKQQANDEPGIGETIEVKGHSFRLPTSRDLAGAAEEADSRAAAVRLIERCRVGSGESSAWSEEDLEEIGERMAMADPMAETRLALHCPECGNAWDETLDIASFLWAEIEARARRLLWEIHIFASTYGWTEAEILSLSDTRRALYLEMVRA
jgi:hypothetical protein